MKSRTFIGILVTVAIIFAVAFPFLRERAHIRARVGTMQQALRDKDGARVMTFVASKRHARLLGQNDAEVFDFFLGFLGTDRNRPWVWVHGDEATVVPHPQFHFLIFPGGNGVEMVKENGEWYFNGHLLID